MLQFDGALRFFSKKKAETYAKSHAQRSHAGSWLLSRSSRTTHLVKYGDNMFGQYLEPGDKVKVFIDKESRQWGVNPCPDGTVGTFVDLTEIFYERTNQCGKKPGVHSNSSYARILIYGKEHIFSTHALEFEDRALLAIRQNKYGISYSEISKKNSWRRDLPNLPYWEWDEVAYNSSRCGSGTGVIERIDYAYHDSSLDDGTPFPIYQVKRPNLGTIAVAESNLQLIQRGQIWKWYHKEPIQFSSLEEEANLHKSLGLYSEVRNPSNGLYKWTLEEVLQAIRDGLGHGLSVSGGITPFSGSIHHYLIKFHDEVLGEKVAQATLRGFNIE